MKKLIAFLVLAGITAYGAPGLVVDKEEGLVSVPNVATTDGSNLATNFAENAGLVTQDSLVNLTNYAYGVIGLATGTTVTATATLADTWYQMQGATLEASENMTVTDSNVTCQVAGWYSLDLAVGISDNTQPGAQVDLRITTNGTEVAGTYLPRDVSENTKGVTAAAALIYLESNDVVAVEFRSDGAGDEITFTGGALVVAKLGGGVVELDQTIVDDASSIPSGAAVTDSLAAVENGAVPYVKNTVVLLGDSLTAQNKGGFEAGDISGGQVYAEQIGLFNWARCFVHAPLNLVTNMGVGGETTADMVDRIDAVAAADADIVIVCAGRNDISNALSPNSYAATISNLNTIVETLQAARKRVVITTITPVVSADTAEDISLRNRVNAYILNMPYFYPGLAVADIAKDIEDFETGLMITADMSRDAGTHWSSVACARMAPTLANAINTVVPQGAFYFPSGANTNNILVNSSFEDTSDWTVDGAGSFSVVESSDGFNNIGVISITNGVSYSALRQINFTNESWGVGDTVKARMDVEWSVTNGVAGDEYFFPYVWIRPRKTNDAFGTNTYALLGAGSDQVALDYVPESGRMVLETPTYTVEDGINRLYQYFGWYGISNGVVKIHRVALYKED